MCWLGTQKLYLFRIRTHESENTEFGNGGKIRSSDSDSDEMESGTGCDDDKRCGNERHYEANTRVGESVSPKIRRHSLREGPCTITRSKESQRNVKYYCSFVLLVDLVLWSRARYATFASHLAYIFLRKLCTWELNLSSNTWAKSCRKTSKMMWSVRSSEQY